MSAADTGASTTQPGRELDRMVTLADALRWALSRIPADMRGDYWDRAAEILRIDELLKHAMNDEEAT